MFIVSIFGGLGSQMEQYAFYLSLKKAYPDTIIKLGINNFSKPDHNGFELERVFGIRTETASVQEICRLSDFCPLKMRFSFLLRKLFHWKVLLLGHKESWITPDDPSAFYKEVFQLNPLKDYLFHGNWGHEEYRKRINEEILQSFVFPAFDSCENISIAKEIMNTNSISIHVRHGDYIQYGYPVLPMGYYRKAIEIIKEKIESPVFFIFSDDIEYVKKNFSFLQNYRIIDWNKGNKSYRDMQLMSMCKHNIIANSTFSFWGARLNTNNDAIKISPKYHVPQCRHSFGEGVANFIILDNHELIDYK